MRQHEDVCAELSSAKSTIRQLRALLSRNKIIIPSSIGVDDEADEVEYNVVKAVKAEPVPAIESVPRRKRTRSNRAIEAAATEPLILELDRLNDSAREVSTRGEYGQRLPKLARVPSGSDVASHFEIDGSISGSSALTRDPSLRLMRDVSQGSGFFKDLQLNREDSWNKHIDKWADQMVSDELIEGGDEEDFNFPDPELLLGSIIKIEDSTLKIETQPMAMSCSQSAARAPHAYHAPQLVTASGAA